MACFALEDYLLKQAHFVGEKVITILSAGHQLFPSV